MKLYFIVYERSIDINEISQLDDLFYAEKN